MKDKRLNKKKLCILLTISIFLGWAGASGVLGAVKELPVLWNEARWDHAEQVYATFKGTSVKALRDAEYAKWQTEQQECISIVRKHIKMKSSLWMYNQEDYIKSRCNFNKKILAVPKDDLLSYMSGFWGILPFMAGMVILLIASFGIASAFVYVLPAFIFDVLPAQLLRFWNWLHK